MVKTAKSEYKNKVEQQFTGGNARGAWRGLNTMMGRKQKQKTQCEDPTKLANEQNHFYARFNKNDFSKECNVLCNELVPCAMTLEEKGIIRVLQRVNPQKATGPDGFKGKVLKECATQLGHVFKLLYQLFLNHSFAPCTWKTSAIIPVPKKSNANTDYRPIALTSILCKCMERVVGNQLKEQTANYLDQLQFADRAQRGVEGVP